MNIWTFDQDATNSIAIYHYSEAVACIISYNDIEKSHIDLAQFIVDACNEKTNASTEKEPS